MGKNRYDFIDIVRVIACFWVILSHVNASVLLQTPMSPTWFVSEFFSASCKPAIPLFVMISGYTMLDKVYDFKKMGQKVWRVVLALFVFSAPYYIFQWLDGTRVQISISDFFFSVFQYPQTIAFWYMYMYIGLLIMMPFIQKMVANMDKKDCEIFIGLSLLINATWPIIEYWFPQLTYSRLFDFAIFESYVGLLLMGHYMKKYVTPSKAKAVVAIVTYVVCMAFVVLMTYHEYMISAGTDYFFYDEVTQLPAVLQGVALFYLISQVKLEGKPLAIIKLIGGCTFGIYLISDLLIVRLNMVFGIMNAMGINPLLVVLIFDLFVYAVGFVIVFVLKKIPGIRQLV